MSRSPSRETTNFKLAAIIQSKEVDVEVENALRRSEKIAKARLQRARLYNGGARTKVPKVKKAALAATSPFALPGTSPPALAAKPLTTSSPPGAHEELYRMVQNPTRLNAADPDRVCVNSTRMLEGLRVLPQPPWFLGYQNKPAPPDGNFLLAAQRYGYRGSQEMQQQSVLPCAPPRNTVTTHTPLFLREGHEAFVDEYVPPIIAARQQSVNNLETPKLWPESTCYVQGFKGKQAASSWFYRRETTVHLPVRPLSPEELQRMARRSDEERATLRDFAALETRRSLLSTATAAQHKLESAWNSALQAEATGTLRHTLQQVHPPYEAHTLLDPSDCMRYSGSTALIVHSQSTEELKFRLRMERSRSQVSTPLALRWQHVLALFCGVKQKLKRGQTMGEVIDKLARVWQTAALRGGSETALHRADFVQACGRITFFEDVSARQVSQLYSLFDPAKKNRVRFAELLLMLLALDRPEDAVYLKLQTLWQCLAQFGLDRPLFDLALEVLSTCAASREDLVKVEALFREEFRPRAYDFCVTGKLEKVAWTEELMLGRARDKQLAEEKELEKDNNQSSFARQQYNVCEGKLNATSLVEILQACPALIREVDSQLSARLLACYGRDDRYKEPEETAAPAQQLDFSWIMRREAPKREVFSLY